MLEIIGKQSSKSEILTNYGQKIHLRSTFSTSNVGANKDIEIRSDQHCPDREYIGYQ